VPQGKVKLTVAIPHAGGKKKYELPESLHDIITGAMTHRGHDGEWQILDLIADAASAKRAAARLRKTVPQAKILGLYPVRDSKRNITKRNGANRNGHHNGASRD
jgi:hypothetical protein